MFCPNCGVETLLVDQNFCISCGSAFKNENPDLTATRFVDPTQGIKSEKLNSVQLPFILSALSLVLFVIATLHENGWISGLIEGGSFGYSGLVKFAMIPGLFLALGLAFIKTKPLLTTVLGASACIIQLVFWFNLVSWIGVTELFVPFNYWFNPFYPGLGSLSDRIIAAAGLLKFFVAPILMLLSGVFGLKSLNAPRTSQ